MSAEIPVYQRLFAHGWWTTKDGEKISKYLGSNVPAYHLGVQGSIPCDLSLLYLHQSTFHVWHQQDLLPGDLLGDIGDKILANGEIKYLLELFEGRAILEKASRWQ